MSTTWYESSGTLLGKAPLTYQRIIIEDAAATHVSFRGIDHICYARYYFEHWTCNCVDGLGSSTGSNKCIHLRLLESEKWQKLVTWYRRPKTALFIGEIMD